MFPVTLKVTNTLSKHIHISELQQLSKLAVFGGIYNYIQEFILLFMNADIKPADPSSSDHGTLIISYPHLKIIKAILYYLQNFNCLSNAHVLYFCMEFAIFLKTHAIILNFKQYISLLY
ncbi:hypothetical protein HZS_7622 [Henneguya salminicola]|nr:hypothetical protein HZS_7622 [Henneguya salminicola]